MTYNPTTIANYFITTYGSVNLPLNISQVVSFTYYAYGWYLAFSDCKTTLIKEPLLCRPEHATFSSLYENMINSRVLSYYKKLPNPQGNQKISAEDQRFLDRVWNTYGHLSCPSNLAFFQKGTPWKEAKARGLRIVPMLEVYQHFKAKLTKAENNAA